MGPSGMSSSGMGSSNTTDVRDTVAMTRRSALMAGFALLAVTPMLSACGTSGFQPLYGAAGIGAAVDEKLAQVEVGAIPGRVGQRIRNELIFQATGGGNALPPAYRLDIAIRETVTSTLVRADGDAAGQIYNLDATFRLTRVSDNTEVLKGASYGRAGFERFESIFANVRAREDAENRAARTVAEELKSRLTAYLAGTA